MLMIDILACVGPFFYLINVLALQISGYLANLYNYVCGFVTYEFVFFIKFCISNQGITFWPIEFVYLLQCYVFFSISITSCYPQLRPREFRLELFTKLENFTNPVGTAEFQGI